MKYLSSKLFLFLLIIIASFVIFRVFETPFAENTIDYFSFFVGIYLVTEASYKIQSHKDIFSPGQIRRIVRIILGTCIFTIHLFQYVVK